MCVWLRAHAAVPTGHPSLLSLGAPSHGPTEKPRSKDGSSRAVQRLYPSGFSPVRGCPARRTGVPPAADWAACCLRLLSEGLSVSEHITTVTARHSALSRPPQPHKASGTQTRLEVGGLRAPQSRPGPDEGPTHSYLAHPRLPWGPEAGHGARQACLMRASLEGGLGWVWWRGRAGQAQVWSPERGHARQLPRLCQTGRAASPTGCAPGLPCVTPALSEEWRRWTHSPQHGPGPCPAGWWVRRGPGAVRPGVGDLSSQAQLARGLVCPSHPPLEGTGADNSHG